MAEPTDTALKEPRCWTGVSLSGQLLSGVAEVSQSTSPPSVPEARGEVLSLRGERGKET